MLEILDAKTCTSTRALAAVPRVSAEATMSTTSLFERASQTYADKTFLLSIWNQFWENMEGYKVIYSISHLQLMS